MDDIGRAAIGSITFADHDQATRWLGELAEINTSPDNDWDAFCADLYDRSRAVGVRGDEVEYFLGHLATADEKTTVVDGVCAEPDAVTVAAAYDEAAWAGFLAENGIRWDGFEDTWEPFREWFAYEARENRVDIPAGQFLAYVEQAQSKVYAMAEYGVTVNPLAEFPLLERLLNYPETLDGMRQFLVDETGVDPGE
ncbi:MAG TPA: hypothetical protein VM677_19455 [Actinokineospora sp.]|nr:hypothetical protein [Actinokineospora sp.]